MCAKTLLPSHKSKLFGFSWEVPTLGYVSRRFGIGDFNVYEYGVYQDLAPKLPPEIESSFAPIEGIEGNALIQGLVLDYSGNISRSLFSFEGVSDASFWRRLSLIRYFFVASKIYNFNVKPDNILVRDLGSKGKFPVLFDFKRIGSQTYPLQIHLKLDRFVKQKVLRRFNCLVEEYSF